MPVIHIETHPVAKGSFEFIQTWVDGLNSLDERVYTEPHEDRMYAAMTNLGYACKWLADTNTTRGDICITSDRDGKDVRHNGEHDSLFEAICSRKEYQKNKVKYEIIYGRYAKFLDRIRFLADANEINFTQNEKPFIEVKFHAQPFKAEKHVYTRAGNWSRENLLKLDLKGSNNTLTCNACGLSIIVQQSGNFSAFRPLADNSFKPRALIKTNKQLMEKFLEDHVKMHNVLK